MDTYQLEAYAKINLTLDVLYKREDGFHEVQMIMQAIDLSDTVRLTCQDASDGIALTADTASDQATDAVPLDSTNLACRAAALLAETCHLGRGVHIHLYKRIPVAAGLAGGSADAAAVLLGLNRLWRLNFSLDRLAELGARLGSDVPFCLYGGTMLATGRGELLQPLPDAPVLHLVLAKLPAAVSTASVYRRYRPDDLLRHPDTTGMLEAIRSSDAAGIARRLGNVLETVTLADHPDIGRLKSAMIRHGAMNSLMSGSGPTVFGVAADQSQAESIAEAIKKEFQAQVLVAKTRAGR